MVALWVILGLFLMFLLVVISMVARHTMPLEPALTPGDLSEARDPDYLNLQEQSFRENGFRLIGDFVWRDGLSTVVMRVFLEESAQAYGWVVEESVAGLEEYKHSVSALTEFSDGTLLDTTSAGPTGLAMPPWFRREAVAPDTALLLRRHRERRAAVVGEGLEPVTLHEEDLFETIRRNERRIGEYQVETGRMRLVRGRLRFSAASVIALFIRGIGRILSTPFRGGRRS